MVTEIFIPGNVASGKNSKVWTGRYLVHSKTARKYIKESTPYWIENRDKFLKLIKNHTKPYGLEFFFIRGSKHRFDYHNVVQLPLDLMQEHGWIEDDNSDTVVPYFLPYIYDKENPGLIITIL